jgi:probable rRNA maturation factor
MLEIDLINKNRNSKIKISDLAEVIKITESLNKIHSNNNNIISVLITDNKEIAKYNKQFRNIDKATNILSFPADNIMSYDINPVIGDIIISEEKLITEAAEQDKLFINHLKHIFLHGLLHIFGYDHEKNEDAEIMEAIEVEILKKLNISNPYLINNSE